ncbi:MAG: TetR/AcrR family transcriptional regulator [Alphaproteobacteria bacterium]|nr:TetR/AcrR family transcriptional regulator [Alphaproteobacteria bacterium]
MGKGQQTRERLMDIAEASVLTKGFGATSIDEIIAEAEITKSGFFYHFRDKNELARAMLLRYVENEDKVLDEIFDRARELHDDPLHAFLIGLKLFAEMMADLPSGHPGCLVATVCYNERLFDQKIRDLNERAVLAWRERFLTELRAIAEIYPPKDKVNLEALADMVSSTVEGGIVMSKALGQPKILAEQILLFRSYVKLLFLPAVN